MKPNFLIIGAARCATTSLFKYLEVHPDIFLSKIKEINYFSNSKYWKKGNDWYLTHFEEARCTAIGEASTSYTASIDNDNVPKKIKENLGHLKLIYIVRDPIERLMSHYKHYIDRGERLGPIESILENNLYRDTLWQGRYWFQLQQYLKYFSLNDILIITVEELAEQPQKTMGKVFSHINVAQMDLSNDITQVHNGSSESSNKSNLGLQILDFYHKHIEQRRIPYTLKKIFPFAAEIGSQPLGKLRFSVSLHEKLKDFYKEDVEMLSKDFSINTSKWKNFSE